MTTTYRTYSESKAKRAIANSKTMKKKIDHIIKNTPVPRLQAEVAAVERAYVQLCCPKCKQTHRVSMKDYASVKFRRLCYTCYENETYDRNHTVYKDVCSKIGLPKDVKVSVFTHNPAHQIVISLPIRNYKKE